jgi:hypothetical protein
MSPTPSSPVPNPRLELYQEYPEPDERETIGAITDLLIDHLKVQYRDQPKLRDTHTKSNGLVKATFRVLPDLPQDLRVGLFKEPRSYDCWIRFSNSDSFLSKDKAKDFRGISLKLFEVEGEKLQPDEHGTFDFILLGNDAFFAKHPRDFLAFFRLLFRYKKPLGPLLYILTRWRQAYNLLFGRRVFGNPLEINWFGAVPYRFGDRAVKYRIPRSKPPTPPDTNDPDYLRRRLTASLQEKDWILDFEIQFQLDPYRHPIESALVPWEDSPFYKIAEIHLDRQEFNSPAQLQFDENLTYNPWHCTAEHRPVGGINRARRDVYHALQEFRLAENREKRIDVLTSTPFPRRNQD